MNFGLSAIGSLAVSIIGLISGILIFNAYKKFSVGELKDMMLWLFVTVMFCGFPYAIWTFLIESELIIPTTDTIEHLPGMILVTFFFVFMLVASLKAKKLGDMFGFKELGAKISENLKTKKK